MSELREAPRKTRNRKAPGLDGINAELFKYGRIVVVVQNTAFVQHVLGNTKNSRGLEGGEGNFFV